MLPWLLLPPQVEASSLDVDEVERSRELSSIGPASSMSIGGGVHLDFADMRSGLVAISF